LEGWKNTRLPSNQKAWEPSWFPNNGQIVAEKLRTNLRTSLEWPDQLRISFAFLLLKGIPFPGKPEGIKASNN